MNDRYKVKGQSLRGLVKLRQRIAELEAKTREFEKALHHSEALNRAVFEHSPVGISVRSPYGDLLFVNMAWKKIWGLSDQEIYENERTSRGQPLEVRYPYLRDSAKNVMRVFGHGGEFFLPEIKVDNPKPDAAKWISQYYYAIQDKPDEVEQVVILTQDITMRKQAEEALRESEEKFRTIVENVNIGVFRTTGDPEGRFIQANPALVKMFGFDSIEELLKIRVMELYKNPEERKLFIQELTQKGFVRNKELLLQKRNGIPMWVSVYAKAQHNENGEIIWIDGVIEDITERKRMEEQLRALSLIDDLTGLYNRRGFLTLAEHQLKIASRTKEGMVLIFVDLDDLKEINDRLGHPEGDRALIETTNILKETFRESDIIARIGGDEFVVLALAPDANAEILYTRLQKSVDTLNDRTKLLFELSLSMGIAHYNPNNPCTIDELLTQADKLMYEHKQGKKNREQQSEK